MPAYQTADACSHVYSKGNQDACESILLRYITQPLTYATDVVSDQ